MFLKLGNFFLSHIDPEYLNCINIFPNFFQKICSDKRNSDKGLYRTKINLGLVVLPTYWTLPYKDKPRAGFTNLFLTQFII